MEKRIVSLLLTLVLVSACVLPSFAATGFDRSVMRNGEGIISNEDELGGSAVYTVESINMVENNHDYEFDSGILTFWPAVASTDDIDTYCFIFNFASNSYINMEEIIFKVGNQRYVFSNLAIDSGTYSKGAYYFWEEAFIFLDSNSISLMEQIVKHRDETIKIRVKGRSQNLDFELNGDTISGIVHLYNLYVDAGGLRRSNLENISKGWGNQKKDTLTIYTD